MGQETNSMQEAISMVKEMSWQEIKRFAIKEVKIPYKETMVKTGCIGRNGNN